LGAKGVGKDAGFREEKMMTRKLILLVTSYSLLVTIAGCGYTTRSQIVDKFKTIYVAPFVNKIDLAQESHTANKYTVYRPILETDITRSLINKFLFDGNLRLASEESADLVLKGELVEFRRDPLRYNNDDDVMEYRINIVVNISLLDKKENEIIWKEDEFTGKTTYFTTGAQAESEDQAINDALGDLSRRIVERTVEQW
jgi:hypothetical protein